MIWTHEIGGAAATVHFTRFASPSREALVFLSLMLSLATTSDLADPLALIIPALKPAAHFRVQIHNLPLSWCANPQPGGVVHPAKPRG